jgi:hypothetical protein
MGHLLMFIAETRNAITPTIKVAAQTSYFRMN